MKLKNEFRIIVNLLLVTIVLLATSCVDGFKETELFTSSVRNTTLLSPDSIVFTPSSANDTLVTISWPVVFGAGGYQVSFYKVDDPNNPVVVGTENQVVDGCSTTRALAPDTKYKAVVKTLGNTTYNNKDALAATIASYSTFVPANATIPSGTDLYQYFTANPIQASPATQVYQLEAGGSYTMTGDIPTGLVNITFRGDKITHPTVTMSSGKFISDGAGFNLSTINFDCTNFTGTGLITFNSSLNTSSPNYLAGWSGIAVPTTSPVSVRSCKITGLIAPLIYDNGVKYALGTLVISDCIIGQNTLTKNLISMAGGMVKDLTLSKSTFYNTQIATGGYLIQYANSTNVSKIIGSGWANSTVTLTNSTFWQMNKLNKIANYSGMSQSYNKLTLLYDIFVDTGNQRILKDLCINATMARNIGYNTYWFNGVFATAEITSGYDTGSTDIQTDPQLKDPANGDFTVQGANQISARLGDPRWLP
ncbi:MAG: DUF4992 family lipoprotein [Paludibacter sp.]|nr:DUF4992 family lipoprotein [Paludibacter sp.]